MNKLEELKEELKGKLAYVSSIASKAEAEGRDFTRSERSAVVERQREIADLQADINVLSRDVELRKSIEGLGGIDHARESAGGEESGNSPGAQFARHLKARFNGRIPDNGSPASLAASVAPLTIGGMKALITGDSVTSGGAFVTPQDLGLRDIGTFQRELRIRDVITAGTTTSDSVEYVRVTGYTNSASGVPEATSTSGSSGLKPESALTFERVSEQVKTIAHWIPATTRALSDAGQVRTIINTFLTYGLEEKVEQQIFNGLGIGEDFTGLNKLADDNEVQDQAFATDLLTTTRQAKTKVRTVGRAIPSAFILHPNDWQKFDLTQNATQGNFYFGGPRDTNAPKLWGLPVIESEAATEGFGWVADWRMAVLFDRQNATINVGTVDDQMIRNMITILAELRATFAVLRPAAFVRIDLTA